MSNKMVVLLAPIRLKEGVDEGSLLEASDAFQARFVEKQAGVIRRLLLKATDGTYADLVFFESREDAARVAKIEETSAECLDFFRIMEPPDPSLPDMGVLSFEHVKTYE